MSRGLPAFPKKRRGKYFVIRITKPDGSRPWLSLGETREEAYLNYADYIKQVKSKKSAFYSYRPSIKQGIEAYLELKKRAVKQNSLLRFKGIMDNFKQFLAKEHPDLVYLDELMETHFSEYRDYRAEKASPVTINFERDTLSNLFNVLIKEKNLPIKNPVKNVGNLQEPMPDDFFYRDNEVMKILETAKTFSKRINWYAIFATLFYTGMRRNELRFLAWDDLDLDKGYIYIRPKRVSDKFTFEPKDKEIRNIPIAYNLLPIFKSLPKKHDKWVFVNSVNKIISADKIRQEFQKICKFAGLPVKKLHKTRHSWASLMTQDGIPLDVIQDLGGWSDPETMNRYKHLSEDYKARIFREKFTLGNKKND